MTTGADDNRPEIDPELFEEAAGGYLSKPGAFPDEPIPIGEILSNFRGLVRRDAEAAGFGEAFDRAEAAGGDEPTPGGNDTDSILDRIIAGDAPVPPIQPKAPDFINRSALDYIAGGLSDHPSDDELSRRRSWLNEVLEELDLGLGDDGLSNGGRFIDGVLGGREPSLLDGIIESPQEKPHIIQPRNHTRPLNLEGVQPYLDGQTLNFEVTPVDDVQLFRNQPLDQRPQIPWPNEDGFFKDYRINPMPTDEAYYDDPYANPADLLKVLDTVIGINRGHDVPVPDWMIDKQIELQARVASAEENVRFGDPELQLILNTTATEDEMKPDHYETPGLDPQAAIDSLDKVVATYRRQQKPIPAWVHTKQREFAAKLLD